MEPDRKTVSTDVGLNLWANARLFGLLNLALADGYIGSFETKYLYNFWRPVTAIQNADTDGNPKTEVDPDWTPLVQTPPISDYDSAHSVEGGAAAQVLRRFFGTDDISFETCSLTLPAGSTCNKGSALSRSYTSFSEAADENALSRILVGSISGGRARKGSSTAVGSAIEPSSCSCVLFTKSGTRGGVEAVRRAGASA
ncbi:MAG: vanadium-dependent haloperoxidase [Actinomycetota bacterium]